MLELCASGVHRKEIAWRLGCTISTVDTYWRRIVQKTGFATSSEVLAAILYLALSARPQEMTVIDGDQLPFRPDSPQRSPDDLMCLPSLRQMEWSYIGRVLGIVNGDVSLAARILGIRRSTLERKLERPPRW